MGLNRTKYGDEINVGDIVIFLGLPHRVDAIEDVPSIGVPGFTYRSAVSNDGWRITLEVLTRYEIA